MSEKSVNQPRIGVGVFVIREGKFLVGQRKGAHGAGSWSVPGGWLEYQETFEDASAREIDEETGMKIKNIGFVALTNNIFVNEDIHSLTVWMTADWDSGEPSIKEPHKFVDQQWVDFDTLPAPLFLPWDSLLVSEFMPEIKRRLAVSKTRG